ncbi:MAG: PIN domain-containing protein [Cyanobacteria bacterium P01_F01_bin.150]
MNIYVETNFVLELTFEQEQHSSCEEILQLCEAELATLILPAYCLAEPHEKLIRQARDRRELQQLLDAELRQLIRTASYAQRIKSIQDLASLILQSNEQEQQRFNQYRTRLLQVADIVVLNNDILQEAASYEGSYGLKPQDAIVYASVMTHLQQTLPTEACFLNRNSKDFDSPDIVEALKQLNCRMIPRFDNGYRFVQSQVSSESSEA